MGFVDVMICEILVICIFKDFEEFWIFNLFGNIGLMVVVLFLVEYEVLVVVLCRNLFRLRCA